MSNTRKPQRTRRPGPRPAALSPEQAELLRRIAAVDEAERRGDAEAALDLVDRWLHGPDGRVFWRPWRIMRLAQLATFGPVLPRWVTSRWLVEQALQELDHSGGPAVHASLATAIEIQGGRANVVHPPGEDAELTIIDTDWAFRQCLLYEQRQLASHLRRASVDLVARADRVVEWTQAPLGGYQLAERRPAVTVWCDLASGELVETTNIGSAVLLMPGEHVIGRLVPVDDGRMFETVPLRVPEPVARAVADEPGSWTDVLREAQVPGEPARTGHRFGFVTDVPAEIGVVTVHEDLTVVTDLPRRAQSLLAAAREALDEPPDDPEDVDVWACLAAEVLHPEVFRELLRGVDAGGADVLRGLAGALAEPAAGLCRALATLGEGAA